MAKITIEKIVPAPKLAKLTTNLACTKKIAITLFMVFIIPVLYVGNSFLDEKLDKKNQNTHTITPSNLEKNTPAPLLEGPQVTNGFEDTIIADTKDYRFAYYAFNQQYFIIFFSTPTEEQKQEVEKVFLSTLNINQEKACELNVVLTVPEFSDEAKLRKSYPLSFCE